MKKQMMNILHLVAFVIVVAVLQACSSPTANKDNAQANDTVANDPINTTQTVADGTDTTGQNSSASNGAVKNTDLSTVLIYNFHITNRCVSCIAIEDATTKTINTYFAKELKQGRIKRYILNVDDDANSKVAEKYQAFGSGCFVTRAFKGKETTTDFTGDGFKYAKNKEEKFIEILKTKISEYLK